MAIAVEVPHRHGTGTKPGGEVAGGLETAVAVAQQHTHGAAAPVGHGEVEMAIAVKVPHRHGLGIASGGEGAGSLEAAVAVAQQHTHAPSSEGPVSAGVGHDKVEMAVAV